MEALKRAIETGARASPAEICQVFFILAASIVLFIQILPTSQRQALMDYGARLQDAPRQNLLAKILDCLQVPHSWFLHFYILSAGLSGFWGWQYVTKGTVLRTLASAQAQRSEGPSMDISQVYVAWALMALQGTRRLYESFFVMKPGRSPMSSIHWLLGLFYYSAMSISVWIQGSSAILESWKTDEIVFRPSYTLALGVAVFALGWLKQHQCHKYLASLKKYTLPDQGWFRYTVCAHYASECLLYLGLVILATPPGRVFNETILLGLAFVAINLGATAKGTKQWYAQKFGADQVTGKWRMIPFLW